MATFSVRLDPRPSAKVVVRVKDDEAGDEDGRVLRNGIAAAREQLAAMSAPPAEADVREFRALARDLFTRGLNSLKVERAQDRVEITLADFAPLTDLTALLKLFNANDAPARRRSPAGGPVVRRRRHGHDHPAVDPRRGRLSSRDPDRDCPLGRYAETAGAS